MEITVETSLLIIRRGANRTPGWCIECSSRVRLITPEEAADLAGANTRTVYRWVETGQLHLIETIEQAPLVCLNSLLKTIQKGGNATPQST
jgi:hypothetical protein